MVGHSAACALAWVAADARPEKVARVALIGGKPNADGETYFGAFEPVDGVVPFPGWEPFEGPDYVDIDSGHWPMYTKPVELARTLADCTRA